MNENIKNKYMQTEIDQTRKIKKVKDNLNFFGKEKMTTTFQMWDDLNNLVNGGSKKNL